jgi:hypothetical protein
MVTGCIVHHLVSPKISLFLRALHAGSKVDLPDLSNQGSEMFIRVIEFITNCRTGVLIDPTNSLNNKFIPYLRAVECVKLKLETILARSDLNFLLESLGKMNSADPSTINKQGVVDLDDFLSRFMETYEKYVQKIKNGASTCIKIMTEYNYLTKGEIQVILRHLSPKKHSQVLKSLSFDSSFELENKFFIDLCIATGILSSPSVAEFFIGYQKNSKEILDFLNENEEKLLKMMEKYVDESLSLEQWHWKIDEIKCKLKTQEQTRYLQLWHILKKEFDHFLILSNSFN